MPSFLRPQAKYNCASAMSVILLPQVFLIKKAQTRAEICFLHIPSGVGKALSLQDFLHGLAAYSFRSGKKTPAAGQKAGAMPRINSPKSLSLHRWEKSASALCFYAQIFPIPSGICLQHKSSKGKKSDSRRVQIGNITRKITPLNEDGRKDFFTFSDEM